MPVAPETIDRLANLSNVTISQGAMLSRYTRFGIGGPAEVYFETSDERSFMAALNLVRSSGSKYVVIGGGTNLIVADAGFPELFCDSQLAASKAKAFGSPSLPVRNCKPWWTTVSV